MKRIFTVVILLASLASISSASLLVNPGFENNDGWVISRVGDLAAGYSNSWSSENDYSFQFYRNTGSTSASYYAQITQSNVDFTNVDTIVFDCQDTGIDVLKLQFIVDDQVIGTYTNNGHVPGDSSTSWHSTATVYDIEVALDQAFTGAHDFTIRFQEIGNYSPADAKYYRIDNLRLVPEPATMSLLSLGLLALRRKK